MNDNEPIRNRIVISVEDPRQRKGAKPDARRGRPNQPRLWPKVVAFLAAFFIVLLVLGIGGGYLWWRHYQTTPAYSVAIMFDAAQRNQIDEFNKHIDDEEIAKRMVSNVTQKAAGRYGLALSGSLQSEVTRLVPTLLPLVKQTVHEELAKQIKDFASKSEPKPFIVVALAIPRFVNITTQGETAKATSKVGDREISVGLQRDGDLWKIVEVDDDVLLQRIVDNVIKEMPAIGRDLSKLDILPSKKSKKR